MFIRLKVEMWGDRSEAEDKKTTQTTKHFNANSANSGNRGASRLVLFCHVALALPKLTIRQHFENQLKENKVSIRTCQPSNLNLNDVLVKTTISIPGFIRPPQELSA